jgi:hypothetical protein
MTTDQKDEATAKAEVTRLERQATTFSVSALFIAIFSFALFKGFDSSARHGIIEKAKGTATQEAHSLPAPFPVRAAMVRCVEKQPGWGVRSFTTQAGYSPGLWGVFFGIDPDVTADTVTAAADAMLAECSERFVLEGGTVDEMLARAELLGDYLSDGFRGESLALALNRADD